MEVPPAVLHERLLRAVRAAHELSDALWASMHAELLHGAQPARVSELAQRLADVCATIATLAAVGPPEGGLAGLEAPVWPLGPEGPEGPEVSAATAPAPLRPPESAPEDPIAIHDTRPHEPLPAAGAAAPSGWLGAIARRLERYREDHLPFAVLLIEVLALERLAHAEPAPELERLTALSERALGHELRPADRLICESRGRYWLITPETDRPGARTLAERLARTVRATALHRGVGLEVAIGIAVCPDDGAEAAGLAAHADVEVYAARAAGRSLAPGEGPPAGL
jgi:hypothetical protein